MPLSASVLARLKDQHETLPELVKGFSEDQLKQRINPDKWSAFENLAHLTAYQPVFLQRLHLIEQLDIPCFDRYTADGDPVFHAYLDCALPALLENYATQRFLLNKHLIQMGETLLRRQGKHPVYGCFSVAQWTEFFLLHESHHFFTIFMLTAGLRSRFQP